MNEGKKRVLEMLQEGRITADEALDLLNQLPPGDREQRQEQREQRQEHREHRHEHREHRHEHRHQPNGMWGEMKDDIMEDIKEGLMEAKEGLMEAKDDIKDGLREAKESMNEGFFDGLMNGINEGLNGLNEGLSEVFGGNFFGAKKELFDFTSDAVGQTINSIKLCGKNAPVIIRGHDHNYIRVSGDFQPKKKDIGIGVNLSVDNVDISYDSNAMHSVRILCEVPKAYVMRIHAESKNSHIEVNGINAEHMSLNTKNAHISVTDVKCKELSAKTKNAHIYSENIFAETAVYETRNARIEAENSKAELFDLRTSNASIETDDLDFKRLLLYTSNASIKLNSLSNFTEPAEREIEAHTSNASIKAELPHDVGITLQATTSNGKIRSDIKDMEYETQTDNYIKGECNIYQQSPNRLKVNLSTSNGSVKIK
jgi:DUF4097 and DUF4098 domain-containing protein YvlB